MYFEPLNYNQKSKFEERGIYRLKIPFRFHISVKTQATVPTYLPLL